MMNVRWLLAIPVMLAATLVAGPGAVGAATIRDRGKMFSKDAVEKAQAVLQQVEHSSGVPIVIETIDAIPGLDKNATRAKRSRAIEDLAVERDKAIHDEGIYILMSKHDHVISTVLVRERFTDVLPIGKRDDIRDAFVEEFKNEGGYDAGLLSGARAIEKALHGVSAHASAVAPHRRGVERVQHRAAGGRAAAGRSTLGTFLMIIAGIFGVLLVLRLIGGLFNRSPQGYPGAGGMGAPGPGMGGGPGYYGGAGYGGRGGGFLSSMMGGIGGALAGNWLYDQFSGGRHGQYGSADAGYVPDSSATPDQGGDAIVGADDDAGGGTSWDDAGGGDAGGGGDWGGGGGDWGGGGGGDWGGGGGGDW
jgi:hypothetical protein